MKYGLVEDGVVVSVELPITGTLLDGRRVSNFNKLDTETLQSLGWYPIVDEDIPEYNPDEFTIGRSYSFDGETIIVVYALQEVIPPEVEPDPEPEAEVPNTQAQLDKLIQKLEEKELLTPLDVEETKQLE